MCLFAPPILALFSRFLPPFNGLVTFLAKPSPFRNEFLLLILFLINLVCENRCHALLLLLIWKQYLPSKFHESCSTVSYHTSGPLLRIVFFYLFLLHQHRKFKFTSIALSECSCCFCSNQCFLRSEFYAWDRRKRRFAGLDGEKGGCTWNR